MEIDHACQKISEARSRAPPLPSRLRARGLQRLWVLHCPRAAGKLNPIVKRSRGDQVLRYFILLLSMRCRELFGKWLPGTVATAAGVVFSKKITGHQVRNLVRAHDPMGRNHDPGVNYPLKSKIPPLLHKQS